MCIFMHSTIGMYHDYFSRERSEVQSNGNINGMFYICELHLSWKGFMFSFSILQIFRTIVLIGPNNLLAGIILLTEIMEK